MLQAIESVSQRCKLFRQSTIGFVGKEAELANFLTQSSDSTINVVVQLKGAKAVP